MGRQRRSFSPEFRAKVSLAVLRGERTINQIGKLKVELDWLKMNQVSAPAVADPVPSAEVKLVVLHAEQIAREGIAVGGAGSSFRPPFAALNRPQWGGRF